MAVNAFSDGLMASKDIDSYVISVVATADLPDGAFLTLGNLATTNVYGTNEAEMDVYEAAAPASISDPVVVLDLSSIQQGTIGGNDIRWGIKLYNRTLKAGDIGRGRRLALGDKFYLADGGFTSAPTVGAYAVLTNGSTQLTPAVSAGSDFAVKVQKSMPFTAGMSNIGTNYLLEVVGL